MNTYACITGLWKKLLYDTFGLYKEKKMCAEQAFLNCHLAIVQQFGSCCMASFKLALVVDFLLLRLACLCAPVALSLCVSSTPRIHL
jgi:hypothetical protein